MGTSGGIVDRMTRSIAFVALLLSLPVSADDHEDALARVAEGDEARIRGEFVEALAYYGQAIRLEPGLAVAWHHRGLARRQAGDVAGALADFDKAIELDPEAAGPRNDRGLARADADDLDGAIADYTAAIERGPDAAIPYNNRAFARRLNGDIDGALQDATMALQLNPKYARAFLNRGLCLYDLREWEDALADLARSIELEPAGQDTTRLRLWVLRTRLGHADEASKELRAFLKGRVDDWVTALGKFLLGDLTEDDLLQKAASLDLARQSEAHFFAGSKALVAGDRAAAKRQFQAALGTGVRRTEVVRSAEAELAGLAEDR